MKTEVLREFFVLAKHLNFRTAAQELFIAQSTLSTHISALEREVGFRLVERGAEGTALTEAGTVFLNGAQTALRELDETEERCKALSSRITPVRVQAWYPTASEVSLLRACSDVDFSFVDGDMAKPVLSPLINGKTDILFTFEFSLIPPLSKEADEMGIRYAPVGSIPVYIMMMKSNPLARRKSITREDLRGAEVIMNSASNFDNWKAVILNMLGDDLGLSFHLDPIVGMNNLEYCDFGNSIALYDLPSFRRLFSSRSDVVLFDKVDDKPLLKTRTMAYRPDENNPAIERFANDLITYTKDHSWF